MKTQKLKIDIITKTMRKLGLNNSDIARELKLSRQTISLWLQNRKFPRPKHLLKLGILLKKSFYEIVEIIPVNHFGGHEIYYNVHESIWKYKDNHKPAHSETRPCKYCGKMPTKEGYDACIGFLEGFKSVCCGHGLSYPIAMK